LPLHSDNDFGYRVLAWPEAPVCDRSSSEAIPVQTRYGSAQFWRLSFPRDLYIAWDSTFEFFPQQINAMVYARSSPSSESSPTDPPKCSRKQSSKPSPHPYSPTSTSPSRLT
jgi:hypothetical protein